MLFNLCFILLFFTVNASYPLVTTRLAEWGLPVATGIAGIAYLSTHYFKRYPNKKVVYLAHENRLLLKLITLAPQIGSYFFLLAMWLSFKTFVFEINHVISGSMKPSIQVGDMILVKKYAYGVRNPLTQKYLFTRSKPKRGDIISFRAPHDPTKTYIKRIIGVPGDRIQYAEKQLTINNQPISQTYLATTYDHEPPARWPVLCREERLDEKKYSIYTQFNVVSPQTHETRETMLHVVPQGQYFSMGDNRDNSLDSRYFGCVPEANVLGKVYYTVVSWDKFAAWKQPLTWLRWERIGTKLS